MNYSGFRYTPKLAMKESNSFLISPANKPVQSERIMVVDGAFGRSQSSEVAKRKLSNHLSFLGSTVKTFRKSLGNNVKYQNLSDTQGKGLKFTNLRSSGYSGYNSTSKHFFQGITGSKIVDSRSFKPKSDKGKLFT